MFLATVFFNFGRTKAENLSLKNGYFSNISGHFFGCYIDIFHKTEIQTVILRCLVCKNLNWIKSYDTLLVKIFIFSFCVITSKPIKVQTRSAPQNDRLNLSLVKHIKIVVKKSPEMVKKQQ